MKNVLEAVQHEGIVASFEKRITDEQVRISGAFVRELEAEMKRQELTHTDVAWTLGKKRPYISRVLGTPANMTIKSIVELAHAVGLKVEITLKRTKPNKFAAQEPCPNVKIFEPWPQINQRLKREGSIEPGLSFMERINGY